MTQPASTARTPVAGTGPRLISRPWVKPVIGIVLLSVILFTAPVVGWLEADGKIDESIDREASRVDVLVDLPFEPEQYHREALSALGVYAGRGREDATRLRLRAVEQENLERIARFFWVEQIEPL